MLVRPPGSCSAAVLLDRVPKLTLSEPTARQTRRPRHACGRLRRFPLLHHLDVGYGMLFPREKLHMPAGLWLLTFTQPFVDADHPLHSIFPPRVWAIRIPVILVLLGSAVVGSFLGVVMIRSNRKKAAKAKAAAAKKKA